MILNTGIITEKMQESVAFYSTAFGCKVRFENEFYAVLETPAKNAEISFLLPNHPTQNPIFHKPFAGQGIYLIVEVENVDAEYERIKALNIPITLDIRDEEWGERHFTLTDPNGVNVDVVTYPQQ